MMFAGWALSVALAQAAPGAAMRPLSLTLICRGAEARMAAPAPRRMGGGMSGMGGMAGMGRMGGMGGMGGNGRMETPKTEKVAAQINLILNGDDARLWLSDGLNFRGAKESEDGWHVLTELVVDETSIRASAPFGMMGHTKLRIDRTNGEASLGGFQGVCYPAMTGPSVHRF
jgi:hypothetical protein